MYFPDLSKQSLCVAMELPAYIQVWDASWGLPFGIKYITIWQQLCQSCIALQVYEYGNSGAVNLLQNTGHILC